MLPALRAGQIWRHPLASAALRQSGDPALPGDMLTLAGRLPGVLDMLDRLPQTYAHGDASPQNLLLPVREPGTVIVIDWGFGSLLPVGFDLGQLLVGLAHAGPQPHPRPRARPEAAGRPGRFETAGVSDFALGKLAEHSATGSVRLARVILVQAIRTRWPVTSRCGRSRTWLPRRLPIE